MIRAHTDPILERTSALLLIACVSAGATLLIMGAIQHTNATIDEAMRADDIEYQFRALH